NGGARSCARFQGFMGVCGILERKALIDLNAHLSRSHYLEQLVRGSFKLFSSRDVVEEEWARQKQRTFLRQEYGCNRVDWTGRLSERHHQATRSLHALVEFARAGSIAGAADRLFRPVRVVSKIR